MTVGQLIYAGQAGATTRRAGTERTATLRSRISRNHLGGNIGSSTFRKTLTALLFEPLGLRLAGPDKLDTASTKLVTGWMKEHLSLATVACRDRATLAALEEMVLLTLDPPLNLMGMRSTPARSRIKELRRTIGRSDALQAAEQAEMFEPVPGGSEAQLDLLLAEELAANPALSRYILGLPADTQVSNAEVAFYVWDGGTDCCGSLNAGENDLEVRLQVDGVRQTFLIEDKVWG